MSTTLEETDLRFTRFLKSWLAPFRLGWRPWSPPADSCRLMADLNMEGDAFYEFAEAFAGAFCAGLRPPPAGPLGYVEVCPPDLTVAEWKTVARAGLWPDAFWRVA